MTFHDSSFQSQVSGFIHGTASANQSTLMNWLSLMNNKHYTVINRQSIAIPRQTIEQESHSCARERLFCAKDGQTTAKNYWFC
jgi:hypothetical protein